MIISKTPFRLNFIGEGTDLNSFYNNSEGKVFSAAINKYIYVIVKKLPPIVDYKYRINWAKSEAKNRIDDIEHPIVREALRALKIDFPIEITTFADIPSNYGLGSSSAFSVGLLNALYALKREMVSKEHLASLAAKIENDILGRNMGVHNHYTSAFGDIKVLTFHKNNSVIVEPVYYKSEAKNILEKNLMLFFIDFERDTQKYLKNEVDEIEMKNEVLQKIIVMIPDLCDVISKGKNLSRIGGILKKSWDLERNLKSDIIFDNVDKYYERAINAGAVGGRLLGTQGGSFLLYGGFQPYKSKNRKTPKAKKKSNLEGGGFLLFYVNKQKQKAVKKAMATHYQLPFKFDNEGTRIAYYDQTEY